MTRRERVRTFDGGNNPVRHEVGTEQFLKPATLQRVGTKRRVEPGGDDGAQLAMRSVGWGSQAEESARASPLDDAGYEHLMAGADRYRILIDGAGKGLEIIAQAREIDDLVDEAGVRAIGRP